ncbi:MAG: serine protease [Chloroflexota bacterium]|nr:serine protease [Chloroflexota bacterium]
MITTNVVQRTLHIRFGNKTGTAFAIDREDRQYLVTARHLLEDAGQNDGTYIYKDKKWVNFQFQAAGIGEGETDVAVMALPFRIAPRYPLEPSSGGMLHGQQVFFLGFPFGWDGRGENINHGYPVPFVKAGVMSAVHFGEPSLIYIDAHGNKGFSGGPVVYRDPSKPNSDLKVAGVVAHGPTPIRKPIVDERGLPLVEEDGKGAYFAENQGFVVAIGIRHVVDLIDSNPIGFSLPAEEAE